MGLRGVKPELVQKRLKAFIYGNAGVGKTTAAISFPKPYLIDGEKGSQNDQYVKKLKDSGGVIFNTTDFNELVEEVKSLLSENHEYKTLIIDPLTPIYNDLVEKCATTVGTEYGRHYGEANKRIKHLMNLLVRLDMNVIVTSHAKNEYGENLKVIGTTFDCHKKMDYLFDICIEVQKRGKERVGLIKKSRIELLPDGETFPFSYEEIAKRYGKDILEKDVVAQELASDEDVKELERLIDLMKIPQEVTQKWLDKAESICFKEMPKTSIETAIKNLNSKIKGTAA